MRMAGVGSLIALTFLTTSSAAAQAAAANDQAEVLAVVTRLFDGMRKRDSSMVSSVFRPGAKLVSAFTNREGKAVVQEEAVENFVKMVGGATGDTWDERIFEPEVRIDGNLATVWTRYEFWLGTKFSHCGVDAFQMAKSAEGWKVVALADTRKREGCPGH